MGLQCEGTVAKGDCPGYTGTASGLPEVYAKHIGIGMLFDFLC